MSDRETILMCPPEYFSVDHVINPWMAGNTGQLDRELAINEWHALENALSQYADIELMDPQPDLPDLVFTANKYASDYRSLAAYRGRRPS